jgi:hypothetical protein
MRGRRTTIRDRAKPAQKEETVDFDSLVMDTSYPYIKRCRKRKTHLPYLMNIFILFSLHTFNKYNKIQTCLLLLKACRCLRRVHDTLETHTGHRRRRGDAATVCLTAVI